MHTRTPPARAWRPVGVLAALLCLALAATPALAKSPKAKAKVKKPSAVAVMVVGTTEVTLGKKGKVKTLHFASDTGAKYAVTLDGKGRKLAKAAPDARLEVVAKLVAKGKKGKKQQWLKVRKFRVLPADSPQEGDDAGPSDPPPGEPDEEDADD